MVADWKRGKLLEVHQHSPWTALVSSRIKEGSSALVLPALHLVLGTQKESKNIYKMLVAYFLHGTNCPAMSFFISFDACWQKLIHKADRGISISGTQHKHDERVFKRHLTKTVILNNRATSGHFCACHVTYGFKLTWNINFHVLKRNWECTSCQLSEKLEF